MSEPNPPLIVLGVRRSGTTLLRVMLDRNPALAVPDESYFVPQLAAGTAASSTRQRSSTISGDCRPSSNGASHPPRSPTGSVPG